MNKIANFQMISCIFFIMGLMTAVAPSVIKKTNCISYENARRSALKAEDLLAMGGSLHLNSRESNADDIFMKYKYAELDIGFKNPAQNPAGIHFFKAKPLIDSSKIFKFLKRMPKGAVLHAHNAATVSSEWVVKNIFYLPGLLRCTNKNGLNILTFRRNTEKHQCASQYVLVSDERRNSADSREYDKFLEKSINLYTDKPELEYSTINKVWDRFQDMFRTIKDVLLYIPAYRLYHRQMLQELYDDNVMYAEVRINFKELYDDTGNTFPAEYAVTELIDVVEKFQFENPKFLGIKMIYSVNRNADIEVIQKRFETFKQLYYTYPDYIVGFDLVGQEDKGKPLHYFVNALISKPRNAKFFFHAGETNWYGASSDNNLLDALLLNTTRIGHGFALIKHPLLWKSVKVRDIAVEVSPISNQVLDLVLDLRNHPASFYISQNIPIVICNDDPGFWNAKGLSYDFYYAIMSLAPSNAGLKTLKQLVWNSIKYSTMEPNEKQKAYNLLQTQWDQFIEDVVNGIVV